MMSAHLLARRFFQTALVTFAFISTIQNTYAQPGATAEEIRNVLDDYFSFEVKNNNIVLIDRQDRTKNSDPNRLTEGWNDFYWLRLEENQ